MLQAFFIPFITISLAELGDKTQIAILLLATRTSKHFSLFLGVLLAFLIADGIAVLLGGFLTNIVPSRYLKIGSGLVFIIFGLIMFLNRNEEAVKADLKKPFLSGFGLIFVSELGDKTQIASGLFATRYNPVLVFLGVISALTILSLMAILVGNLIKDRLNRRLISYISAVVFIIIGILCFI